MPAAQDKIVYLYFICNCIVKSVACALMFSCIVQLHILAMSMNPLTAGMET